MKKIISIPDIPSDVISNYESFSIERVGDISRKGMLEKLSGCNGIIAGDTITYDQDFFAQADSLEVISRFGVGVDNVDIEAAESNGVAVTNVPGANAESVAEHTIGLMIAVSKNFVKSDTEMRDGNWVRDYGKGLELANKTLGQIGFGNVGSLVALKSSLAFNMNLLVYDPYVPDYEVYNTVYGEKTPLNHLLQESDFISVNLPLTEETQDMLGADEFKVMDEDAILVNTGRGEVVVEEDLATALKKDEIFGAGLDVLRNEPTGDQNPLFDAPRTVLTPHAASHTLEVFRRVAETVLRDQEAVFDGRKPRNIKHSA